MADSKKPFLTPDQVRTAALTYVDILEKSITNGTAIAGTVTFLVNGGVSFRIRLNTPNGSCQKGNCKEFILAVLAHIINWKLQGQNQGEADLVLLPEKLKEILLSDSLDYAKFKAYFTNRAKIPVVGLKGVDKFLSTDENVLPWLQAHRFERGLEEIKVEAPGSLCNRQVRLLL
ncbi:uncharacterized protein CCOS01_13252 [Colletotrichum costaricense]|uniref:Uncharacterized protein n=1 Tax=Colletotrichum costaricense TaxID=1209916 RepID=A0AAJ0DV57_9PEZI|nr:uncharacterized protein CCOS01_13252 [Colletotrichum costaricense]KAK1515059.1 hypothetical protein CCOS01_13252 [Colletotrichum costaricense]